MLQLRFDIQASPFAHLLLQTLATANSANEQFDRVNRHVI